MGNDSNKEDSNRDGDSAGANSGESCRKSTARGMEGEFRNFSQYATNPSWHGKLYAECDPPRTSRRWPSMLRYVVPDYKSLEYSVDGARAYSGDGARANSGKDSKDAKEVRETIARLAEGHHKNKSTAWAVAVAAEQRVKGGQSLRFRGTGEKEGDRKCNLFAYDMLYDAGVDPVTTPGGWPCTASMWTRNVPGFEKVNSQQRGDIVSDGIHCGIAIDGEWIIAAGTYKIVRTKTLPGATIQRYVGHESDEEKEARMQRFYRGVGWHP